MTVLSPCAAKKEIEQLRKVEEINPKIFLFADDNVEEGQIIILGDFELKKRMIEEIKRIWAAHGKRAGK